MKKAVTLLAFASVAMSTEMGDFADHNLNFFKKIGDGLKKAGKFVVQHPQIITTAVKILALEDQVDNELFNFDHAIRDGKTLLKDIKEHHYDDAIHHIAGKNANKVDEQIKKFKEFAAKHPELVEKFHTILKKYKDTKIMKEDIKKAADFIKKLHAHKKETVEHDDELFNFKEFIHHVEKDIQKGAQIIKDHPAVVNDGVHIVKDIKAHDYKQAIEDGIQALKDLGFEDEELFHFGDFFKKAGKEIKKGIEYAHDHPAVVKDGVTIAKDIKTHQYKKLPDDVVQTLKDMGFDDEEFFSFGKVGHAIKDGVKKGAHFVKDHPAIIKDGVNIVKDVKGHQYGKLIKDGVKTYKDLGFEDEELFVDFDDEELFNLGKVGHAVKDGVKKGAHFIKDHPAVIKDGVNIVKDVKGHQYGKLIKDGVKTYKDLGFEDEELFVEFDDEELFSFGKVGHAIKDGVNKGVHFVKDHPAIIKDGVNIVKDVKGHQYGKLIKDGVKTYKDLGFEDEELFVDFDDEELFVDMEDQELFEVAEFDDDELFNIKDIAKPHVIGDAVHIAKDIKNKQIGNLVHDGVKIYRDLGFEDQTDNALFNLGELVKDGLNIAHDVKTKNYGDLVNHGIKTVKDIKNKDKKFLF